MPTTRNKKIRGKRTVKVSKNEKDPDAVVKNAKMANVNTNHTSPATTPKWAKITLNEYNQRLKIVEASTDRAETSDAGHKRK